MADNIRVLDCCVDELAANLNSAAGEWLGQVWNFYDRGAEWRVTVVMGRILPQPVQLPPGFDVRGNRRT